LGPEISLLAAGSPVVKMQA